MATILKHALADPDGVFVSHNPLVKFQTTFLNLDVYSVYIIYLYLNEHAPPPPFPTNHRDSTPRKKYKTSTTTKQGNTKYLPFSLLFLQLKYLIRQENSISRSIESICTHFKLNRQTTSN